MADNVYGVDLVAGTSVTITKALIAGARGNLASYTINSTGGAGAGAVTQLADTTLGASAANIDLTSISAAYNHLLLLLYTRNDRAAQSSDDMRLRFNNDSAANYYFERVFYFGPGTASGVEGLAATSANVGFSPASGAAPASSFGTAQIWIPNYANTTNHKVAQAAFFEAQGTATNTILAGLSGLQWKSAAAISRITLFPNSGANWVAGSRATLYGMT